MTSRPGTILRLWKRSKTSPTSRRSLHLHTFQSQALLKEVGIPVPRDITARSVDEVREAMRWLGGPCFIKPQFIQTIHGRRQLSSGIPAEIDFAKNPEDGATIAARMLGYELLPGYPGEREHMIKHVDVLESIPYDRNWKLCMTIDRENYCPTIILIEDGSIVRSQTMEHCILPYSFPFGFTEGITPALTKRIADRMSLPDAEATNLKQVLQGLYQIFVNEEATSLDIDDLVRRSADGQLMCMNSRFTFDDAAQSRQPDIFALRDFEQEVSEEVEAEQHGLVYVRMDGNIGNVVNGAGLAMATNDAISHYGGKSANFLDAGGKATTDTMLRAFDIILRDERVTAILVNIYGGLTRCDMIAESIIAAASELGPLVVPVVVRLQGTNSEEGLAMVSAL